MQQSPHRSFRLCRHHHLPGPQSPDRPLRLDQAGSGGNPNKFFSHLHLISLIMFEELKKWGVPPKKVGGFFQIIRNAFAFDYVNF
jgi:hypothetical protein